MKTGLCRRPIPRIAIEYVKACGLDGMAAKEVARLIDTVVHIAVHHSKKSRELRSLRKEVKRLRLRRGVMYTNDSS